MKIWLSLMCLMVLSTTAKSQQPVKLTEHPTIKAMFDTSNKVRTKNGLAKSRLSDELTGAAQDHAWYMARQHDRDDEDFNHRGGNSTPGKRASHYCYEGTVKENIARGYTTINDTFEAWLKSDSHRDAIYSDSNDVGFGYAVAKDGTTYWVGVYGKPVTTWDLIGPEPHSHSSLKLIQR